MIERIYPLEGGHPLGDGIFGHGVHMHRGDGYNDPMAGGGGDIDLVEAHAPAGDDAQIAGGFVKFIGIQRRTGD